MPKDSSVTERHGQRYPVESFFMWQGRCLSKLSRHDEAIESYRLVTDLEPKHADAYHELGCSYAELGRYKELAPHTNVK